jgi:hypothetical protein
MSKKPWTSKELDPIWSYCSRESGVAAYVCVCMCVCVCVCVCCFVVIQTTVYFGTGSSKKFHGTLRTSCILRSAFPGIQNKSLEIHQVIHLSPIHKLYLTSRSPATYAALRFLLIQTSKLNSSWLCQLCCTSKLQEQAWLMQYREDISTFMLPCPLLFCSCHL